MGHGREHRSPVRLPRVVTALAAIGVALIVAAPMARAGDCYDVSNGEPTQLEGLLSYRVFPGPPNFEDVSKGDQPEPAYVLTLDAPICLTGDEDFTDPQDMFDEVQLVPTEATEAQMEALRDKPVKVELENPMPANTVHHHLPLVAWVTTIEAR